VYSAQLALSLDKISCVSGIKMKFVPLSEDLIINQIVYSAQLALSLDKISCVSGIKMKFVPLLFCIPLDLHYLCIRIGQAQLPLALELKRYQMKKQLLLLASASLLFFSASVNATVPPIMGWSSWNAFRVHINDSIIQHQALMMVKDGLKDVGFNYINIDDGFFGLRDANGNMTPHPDRFPNGLKGTADYIHSLGLKAGIYTDAGYRTCGSMGDGDKTGIGAGIYGHEHQDAELYFKKWGFDFIKIDYCGGSHLGLDEQTRYTEIHDAFVKDGFGHISMNICRWAFPGTWAKDIAASWRISGDINASWKSIKYIIDKNLYLSAFATDGHYNDMDMLVVGLGNNSRVGGNGLTQNEEETHFGMWCMMNSPLVLGCDMDKIPASSLKLLKNKELIAINQDSLGMQAYVAQHINEGYILVRDIINRNGNTRAVAFYNPSDTICTFDLPFKDIDLDGKVKIRDIMGNKNIGSFRQSFSKTVPAHSALFMKMTAERRLEPTKYEAEWAFLPQFNDLGKSKNIIRYMPNEKASGQMVVGYLGGSPDNYAEWKNVYSEKGGNYKMTITYFVDKEARDMLISVNGNRQALRGLTGHANKSQTATFNIHLNPGENDIKIGNDFNWAPDIDKIELTPLSQE
jgi:hypothetical protein